MSLSCRLLALLILVAPSSSLARGGVPPPVDYPLLPARAVTPAEFVPAGWRVEASAAGDLDRDARSDLALVLRMRDTRNILSNDGGLCGETLDTNPRMIVVALAAPEGGYRLGLHNWELIPRRDNACAVDWFGSPRQIAIANGTLRIDLERMMSAGGWGAGTSSFRFRWEDADLKLIGFDYSHLQRNSGALSLLSVNYLTGRAKITQARIDSDREQVRWVTLHHRSTPSIQLIGDGLNFDPENLVTNLP